MHLNNTQIDSLIADCCDKDLADAPAMHIMPHFDRITYDWLNDDKIANGKICDEFALFCDLESRSTYAIICQIGGFFRHGMIFAGGLQIDSSHFIPEKDSSQKISLAGYCWEEDGTTWILSNTSTLEDEINEAWADCDDWLFGPCYFMDIQRDGTGIPETPEGMIRSYEEDGSISFQPAPDWDRIEENMLQMGFRRNNAEIERLEETLANS